MLQHLIGDAVAFASLLKGLRKFMSSVVKVRILYGVQVSERQLAAFFFSLLRKNILEEEDLCIVFPFSIPCLCGSEECM